MSAPSHGRQLKKICHHRSLCKATGNGDLVAWHLAEHGGSTASEQLRRNNAFWSGIEQEKQIGAAFRKRRSSPTPWDLYTGETVAPLHLAAFATNAKLNGDKGLGFKANSNNKATNPDVEPVTALWDTCGTHTNTVESISKGLTRTISETLLSQIKYMCLSLLAPCNHVPALHQLNQRLYSSGKVTSFF